MSRKVSIFFTFILGTISYYPRGPIMGKGNSSNSKTEWNSLNHFTICSVSQYAQCRRTLFPLSVISLSHPPPRHPPGAAPARCFLHAPRTRYVSGASPAPPAACARCLAGWRKRQVDHLPETDGRRTRRLLQFAQVADADKGATRGRTISAPLTPICE